ncbi:hypothetical protein CR513_41444, partial [Mucuna pruriens]
MGTKRKRKVSLFDMVDDSTAKAAKSKGGASATTSLIDGKGSLISTCSHITKAEVEENAEVCKLSFACESPPTPTPTSAPWPDQFHVLLYMNLSEPLDPVLSQIASFATCGKNKTSFGTTRMLSPRHPGSQLLPHAANIVCIVTKYFKTCELPELRTKVYSVTRNLLIVMDVGMALYLAQEVINNVVADLSSGEHKNGGILNGSNSNASSGALLPPSHRKRKHNNTTGSLQEHDEGGGLGVLHLRLEAFVTVAGALKFEPWRSKVDSLLIVIAMDSFKEGSVSRETSVFQQKEPAATALDLQHAALPAILVPFLSFARVQPPCLAQGLEIFCRGKQKTGTKLA